MLAMCSRLNLEMDCPLPQVSPTVAPALAMNFGQNKRHNSWKRTTESGGEREMCKQNGGMTIIGKGFPYLSVAQLGRTDNCKKTT